jgi:hypothetical protein
VVSVRNEECRDQHDPWEPSAQRAEHVRDAAVVDAFISIRSGVVVGAVDEDHCVDAGDCGGQRRRIFEITLDYRPVAPTTRTTGRSVFTLPSYLFNFWASLWD